MVYKNSPSITGGIIGTLRASPGVYKNRKSIAGGGGI